MNFDTAKNLQKQLIKDFVFLRKAKTESYPKAAVAYSTRKDFKRNLVGKLKGISVATNEDEHFLKFYSDGHLPEANIADFLGVDPDCVIVQDVGIISTKTRRYSRPTFLGHSISHWDGASGSIGCVLRSRSGERFVLSNNHVLANCNDAKESDAVLQPGAYDGGKRNEKYTIGELYAFRPIDFVGINYTDWALAKLYSDQQYVEPIIPDEGKLNGHSDPQIFMDVFKYGRSTKMTFGIIETLDADIKVEYEGGLLAFFEDQMEVASNNTRKPYFSKEGDSGSVIVNQYTKEAVGLLFSGGDDGTTFANNLNVVLNDVKSKISNFTIE